MNNIFSIRSIKPNTSILGIDSLDICSESYLNLSLDYILHSRNNIINSTKDLYSTVLESKDNYNIMNKSFIDFFNNTIEIIDSFIKFIKSLFDKFMIYLNSAIKSDSFIIKNKDKFIDFSTIHEFEMEIFNYSISDRVPLPYAAVNYKDNFLDLIDENSVKAAYTRLNNSILNNFYDNFRATVVGLNGDYITQSDYNNALFRVYRSGDIGKSIETITRDKIYESIDNFVNFDSLKRDISRTRDMIIKEYEDIRKFILSSVSIRNTDKDVYVKIQNNIIGDTREFTLNDGDTKYINLFIKTKTNQLKKMCDIHTLAFASKLDAIKERYVQDRSILYAALQRINKYPLTESGYNKIPKVDVKKECKDLYDEFIKYIEGKEGISAIDYKFDTITQRGYRQILEIPVGKYKDGRAAWRTVKDLNDTSSNIKLEPKKKGDNWILRIVLSDPDIYVYELSGEIVIGGTEYGL